MRGVWYKNNAQAKPPAIVDKYHKNYLLMETTGIVWSI